MKVGFVIPTYNERENIQVLIPKIFAISKKHDFATEILVVDDNSPDGTSEVVEVLAKKYNVNLVKRGRKLGLGSAYIEGFNQMLQSDADVIFQCDADLSHDPENFPKFLEKIKEGYDVVIGSRYAQGGKISGWNFWRRLISYGGNFVGRKIGGLPVNDLTSGYRAYKRDVLKNIKLEKIQSSGYAFQLEILAKVLLNGAKFVEVPIIFIDRKFGKSKLSKKDIFDFFNIALKLRFQLL